MIFTPATLIAIFIAMVVYLLLYIAITSVCSIAHRTSSISEILLAGCIYLVLGLNAQVALLSLLPIDRPLEYLWPSTLFILMLIAFFLLKNNSRSIVYDYWKSAGVALLSIIRRLNWASRLFLAVIAINLLVHLIFGLYINSYDWDVPGYHIPMAVQPYQDGRLGTITSDLPWAKTYPKGVEILWYHTLQLTHSNGLFQPVQWAFGIMLVLALYALCRRSGIPIRHALFGAMIIASLPVYNLLSTIGYIDLASAATLSATIVFLSPIRAPNTCSTARWFLTVMALASACLVKLPILPTLYVGIALFHVLFFRPSGRREFFQFFRHPLFLLGFAILVLCNYTYFRNLIVYDNPIYPVQVASKDKVIFPGPMSSGVFDAYHKSTFGPVQEMSRPKRFLSSWLDIFQPLSPETFGQTGIVFIIAILFLFGSFIIDSLCRRNSWHLALVSMFFISFSIPALALPRYGLPMTVIAIVGASWSLAGIRGRMRLSLQVCIILLCFIGIYVSQSRIQGALAWIENRSGGKLSLWLRNSSIPENTPMGYATYVTPSAIKFIRDNSGADDVLAWNVSCFQGLLWNLHYSNRLVHVPGSAADFYPRGAASGVEPTWSEMNEWIKSIATLSPRHILVYAHSPYAMYLKSHPEVGYKIVFEDPPSAGQRAAAIFERTEEGRNL